MYGYAVVFTAPQQFHAPSVSRVAVLDDMRDILSIIGLQYLAATGGEE